ncbi:MAG: hypothetical protein KBD78_10460 [Oligoflexales bacterium]|nr:hypothetical protein [Oligoflexales bacterium]
MTQSLKLSLAEIQGNIREFLDKIKFSNPKNQELWRYQLLTAEQTFSVQTQRNTVSPTPKLLPIEFFRHSDQKSFCSVENPFLEFRSSGTTSSERAHSYFSEDGLLFYKAQSLWTFSKMMAELISAKNPGSKRPIIGLCLIPSCEEWPDSSLAKMAEWLKEFWPLEYVRAEDLKSRVQKLQQDGNVLWLLGTAFHYINLIDAKQHTQLGSTTILIETGGSKGRSRELTRQEYYQLLQASFGLNLSQIISEYGMCELACQAYDYDALGLKDRQNELTLNERKFRFPPWVSLFVTQGLGVLQLKGKGCLTVLDPFRIDYTGAIRTQDVVELSQDGSFSLFGRASYAPLKGCSLAVDEIFKSHKKELERSLDSDFSLNKTKWFVKNINERCEKVGQFLEVFFQKDSTLDALAKDLGSKNAAQSALDDLLRDFPKSPATWLQSLRSAFDLKFIDEKSKDLELLGFKSWTFIAPASHPVALLEPLSLAVLADLDLAVRLPEKFSKKEGFLVQFIQGLSASLQGNIILLPSEWRIVSQNDLQKNRVLLVFGEDSTIKKIERLLKRPIRGLGTKLSFSVVWRIEPNVSHLMIRDAFSLGQQGCLSSRFTFLISDKIELEQVAKWNKQLRDDFKNYWGEALTLDQRISLDHESIRYICEPSCILAERREYNDPLFVFLDSEKINLKQGSKNNLKAYLAALLFSKVPLCLPIVLISQKNLVFWLEKLKVEFSELKQLSYLPSALGEISEISDFSKIFLVKPLGEANRSPWLGQQDGRAYFNL